jgi:PAS domain S-box-containing protein
MSEGIKVLHVDDEPEFAAMVGQFLERAGIDTVGAADADEALDRLHAESFDCVVSDHDMPGENGLVLLEAVRRREPEIPFILFTGKGSEEVASEAITTGVTDYLQKGGVETYEMLTKRIENAVERRRARAEAEHSRRFLEKVVEHATDVIATVDTEGHIVFVSGSCEAVLGYAPDELRGQDAMAFVHPDDRGLVGERFARRQTDPDGPTGLRHRAIRADGSVVELEARAYNLVDDPDVGAILIYSRPVDAASD